MSRRALGAAVLSAFLGATGLHLLLHAHLADERHHESGCEAAAPPESHDHTLAGHAGAVWTGTTGEDRPAHASHEHCGRCVSSPGALRAGSEAAGIRDAGDRHAVQPGRAPRLAPPGLAYELRGPPALA